MLLAEALGFAAFRERVTILATDIDDAALTQARRSIYTSEELQCVGDRFKSKYFRSHNGNFIFRSDLRPSLIFSHHDVIHDVPFAHIDLIACRNTLIYFDLRAQLQGLSRFYYALNPNSYLFLGMAEMPSNCGALFQPVNSTHHLFVKTPFGGCIAPLLRRH